VKRESELAIAHHFGATLPGVGRLRKALGLTTRSPRRAPEPALPNALPGAAEFRERFGSRLCEMREEAGVTREALAERAGLKVSTVQGVEAGKANVSLLAALRLSAALGVPLVALLEPPARVSADYRGRPPRTFTPEEDALLGTMTDQEVALRIGCSIGTVGERRRELGIPSVGPRWHDEKRRRG